MVFFPRRGIRPQFLDKTETLPPESPGHPLPLLLQVGAPDASGLSAGLQLSSLFVPLAVASTMETVFLVIPIVVVLVGTARDPVVGFIVSLVFFPASVVLGFGRRTSCRWCGEGRSKKKGAEKISLTPVHVVLVPAQEFHPGIPGPRRVCSDRPRSDGRYRTATPTTRFHSGLRQIPAFEPGKSEAET